MHLRPHRIAILLALGAITNLAVAWACVFSEDGAQASCIYRPTSEQIAYWNAEKPATVSQQVVAVHTMKCLGRNSRVCFGDGAGQVAVAEGSCLAVSGTYPPAKWDAWTINEIGLPLRSFRAVEWQTRPSHITNPLAYRPMPIGFAVNSVLYASVIMLIGVASTRIRQSIRQKRGQCRTCGYDLRGRGADHAVCPECGIAIPNSVE